MRRREKKELQRIKENLMNIGEKSNQPPAACVTKKRKVDANKVCDYIHTRHMCDDITLIYSGIQLQNKPRSLL